MAKSLLILLKIVLTVNVILASEYDYLGTFIKSSNKYINGTVYDYYISKNPATWSTAKTDCKSYYGSKATLLSIETEEEWEFIQVKLKKLNSQSGFFWSSGMYDEGSQLWKWSSINQPIQSFVPWRYQRQEPNPSPFQRILLYFQPYSTSIQAVYDTEFERYICKVPRSGLAVPCYATNDVVIVLDSSASITHEDYALAKHFIARFVAAFAINEATRIAFITYSQNVSTIINLPDVLTLPDMYSTIIDATYIGSSTATDLGINEAIRQFDTYHRKIPRSMVVLTSGNSSDPRKTATAAANIIAMGVKTYSVGINKLVKREELLAIAGGDRTRVVVIEDFNSSTEMLVSVSEKVCPT